VPGHDRSVADRLVAAFSLRFEGRDDATDIEPDKLGFGNIQGTEARLVFYVVWQTRLFKNTFWIESTLEFNVICEP
jgi:hypothetical protein